MSDSLKDKYPTLAPHQASLVDSILTTSAPKQIYLQAAAGTGATMAVCNAIAIGMEAGRFNRVLFFGRRAMLDHAKLTIEDLSNGSPCFTLDGRSLKYLAAEADADSSIWPKRGVFLTSVPFACRAATDYGILDVAWDLIVFDEEVRPNVPADQRQFVETLTQVGATISVFVSRFDASVQRKLFQDNDADVIEVTWQPEQFQNWSGKRLTRPSVQWNVVEYEMSESETAFIDHFYSCRSAIDDIANSSAGEGRFMNFELLIHRATSSIYSLERALMDAQKLIYNLRNAKAHGRGSGTLQQSLFDDEDFDPVATQMDLFSESNSAEEIANLESVIEGIDMMLHDLERIETDEKLAALLRLLPSIESKHVVVMTRYSATLEFLETAVEQEGMDLFTISGRSAIEERQAHFTSFCENGGLLIMTDAAMKGLEFPPTTAVIHYDLPLSPEMMFVRSARFRPYGESATIQMYAIVERNTPLSRVWRKMLSLAMELKEGSPDGA
ncbi:helicase-related protein [Rubripirellula amarantea]|nr:helicase-related protein [Rubripirellula amarantea]